MGKIAKIWFAIVAVIFVVVMALAIQTFRPVRNVTSEDILKITGTVTDVQEGSGFDIVITLQDDPHYYYINRGLQLGLSVQELQDQIQNKTVTLYPVKRWTIFTTDGNMGHIAKLTYKDKTLFNEIKE
ncbi:hypothetical protein [Aquimarina brevivitae]|uniref:Uncharacterized protein n=1 Tax=Aquimarina brevivitae TaxID=323412 RepID=A0A4Q7PI38_9FLAO|nr:hypothetical protein [Aquimarina brevivitae]RZS99628.1 hypothetical protein EV197_0851 [Aquimarina brevivitae]